MEVSFRLFPVSLFLSLAKSSLLPSPVFCLPPLSYSKPSYSLSPSSFLLLLPSSFLLRPLVIHFFPSSVSCLLPFPLLSFPPISLPPPFSSPSTFFFSLSIISFSLIVSSSPPLLHPPRAHRLKHVHYRALTDPSLCHEHTEANGVSIPGVKTSRAQARLHSARIRYSFTVLELLSLV